MPTLPTPRGPLSAYVVAALANRPHRLPPAPETTGGDEDDFHLALYCCYELHYRGFDGCDPEWEWEPSLLSFRRRLEARFEAELRREIGPSDVAPSAVEQELWALARSDVAPSLSSYMLKRATLTQFREFLVHRSAYHLKEADPHSWAIPRLEGAAKAALIEIQADEYGGGRAPLMHATLFAHTMQALGLDARYGAYLDWIPGVSLASVNLISLLGLHRRLRGALVGHLALFEMTSTAPNRRYGLGLRRLGFGPEATHFFDEHVLADSVHELVAVHDLAASLAFSEPTLVGDIIFGARALAVMEQRCAQHLISSWRAGASSLRADGTGAGIAV
ncbi:MAG: iron-containing redox enzyme family protein [Actinomycetota bacterium]